MNLYHLGLFRCHLGNRILQHWARNTKGYDINRYQINTKCNTWWTVCIILWIQYKQNCPIFNDPRALWGSGNVLKLPASEAFIIDQVRSLVIKNPRRIHRRPWRNFVGLIHFIFLWNVKHLYLILEGKYLVWFQYVAFNIAINPSIACKLEYWKEWVEYMLERCASPPDGDKPTLIIMLANVKNDIFLLGSTIIRPKVLSSLGTTWNIVCVSLNWIGIWYYTVTYECELTSLKYTN